MPTLADVAARRVPVMFALFVLLGLPEGLLGAVWPSIRREFDKPDSGLAQLVTTYMVGYLLAALVSGRLSDRTDRLGVTHLGVAATAVGLVGYVVAPTWWVLLVCGVVLGAGASFVDSSLNAEVALNHDARTMHLLHASFGVGATMGPLLMTLVLGLSVSWRVAYLVLVIVEVGLLVVWTAVRRSATATARAAETAAAPRMGTARSPAVVQGVLLAYFAFYVGAEVSIGHWSFSILEERYSETTAGVAVACYWGGLTAGRFALGFIGDRLDAQPLLRGSVAIAIAATLWFHVIDGGLEVLGLPVAGAALAGIFPALMLMTPVWLGDERTNRAVGYQMAASMVGAVGSSWWLGRTADADGLDAIPPLLVVLVTLLVLSHLATEALTYGGGDSPAAATADEVSAQR